MGRPPSFCWCLFARRVSCVSCARRYELVFIFFPLLCEVVALKSSVRSSSRSRSSNNNNQRQRSVKLTSMTTNTDNGVFRSDISTTSYNSDKTDARYPLNHGGGRRNSRFHRYKLQSCHSLMDRAAFLSGGSGMMGQEMVEMEADDSVRCSLSCAFFFSLVDIPFVVDVGRFTSRYNSGPASRGHTVTWYRYVSLFFFLLLRRRLVWSCECDCGRRWSMQCLLITSCWPMKFIQRILFNVIVC